MALVAAAVPQIPDVSTVGELLPGFAVNSWYGVLAPTPAAPPPAVAALAEALLATAADPAVAATLTAQS